MAMTMADRTDPIVDAEPVPLLDEQRRGPCDGRYGVPRSAIATYLPIDVVPLNSLLGAQLDQAEADANTKVAQKLFQMDAEQCGGGDPLDEGARRLPLEAGDRRYRAWRGESRDPRFAIRASPRSASAEEWLERDAPKQITG
jgi:hypothetical protein